MSIRRRTGTLDEEAIADERCMLDNPWCSLCWKLMGLDAKMGCPLKTDGPYLGKQTMMPALYIAVGLMAVWRSSPELDVQISGNVLSKLDEGCLVVRLDCRLCKAVCCYPAFGLHQRMWVVKLAVDYDGVSHSSGRLQHCENSDVAARTQTKMRFFFRMTHVRIILLDDWCWLFLSRATSMMFLSAPSSLTNRAPAAEGLMSQRMSMNFFSRWQGWGLLGCWSSSFTRMIMLSADVRVRLDVVQA